MSNSRLHCPKCGAEASEGDAYCAQCGAELTARGAQSEGLESSSPPPPPSEQPVSGPPMETWKKALLLTSSIIVFPVGFVWGVIYVASDVTPDRKAIGKWAVGISALMLVIVVVTPDSEQAGAGDVAVESEVQSTQDSVDQEVPVESETETSAEVDLPSGTSSTDTSEEPEYSPVTMAQFKQLEIGMTQEQVFEEIGPGEELSRNDIGGYTNVMYQWEGEGSLGANMNAMFQNGKLIQKSQFGLE
jgi:hypothetical protein